MRSFSLFFAFVLGTLSPAVNASAPMFDAPALSDAELADARGGFSLPGGATVDFGAVITTSVDGVRLLQTQLRVNAADGVVAQVAAAEGVQLSIAGRDAAISRDAGTETPAAAPSPPPAPVPETTSAADVAAGTNVGTVTVPPSAAGSAGATATVAADPSAYLNTSVELDDLIVRHSIGQQISSLVANSGDGRIIDNQLSISVRLDNVQPMAMGSLGFRIQAISLDAVIWRGGP